jgi:uncharacterized protein (TIGR00303 family)
MAFLSPVPDLRIERPAFCGILANTTLSTVPGISGAGPTPESTLLTPALDAELILQGEITSLPVKPNTPTGCPTPASITRAMMELTRLTPLFINAGLARPPCVPCLDMYGTLGADPRTADAVPAAAALFARGQWAGRYLSETSETLVLGESVPGGTTTALCVLRALQYPAVVSSSFVANPLTLKEEICKSALARIKEAGVKDPLDIIRCAGDPMMPVAAGIASSYSGTLILAGGTQMLAVAAVLKAMGNRCLPFIATTAYVRDDASANVQEIADRIGSEMLYVDPGFHDIGHNGLARYCAGEVKEGMGAGGALALAYLLGHSPDTIRSAVFRTVSRYS